MAAGPETRRYDVASDLTPAGQASELIDGLDGLGGVDALGSAPVVRVQWPEIVDPPRRRIVLPMLALFGSAAAVLAAGLVVLANRPPRRASAGVPPAVAAASLGDTDRAHAVRRLRPSEPYRAAIRTHERELHRCVQFHGEMFPVDAEAVIVVGADGRARAVALRPDGAEQSALGSCIRAVLADVTFPPAQSDMEVAIGLAVYR